jgi:hypothetical protein
MKKFIMLGALIAALISVGIIYLDNRISDYCSEHSTVPEAPEYPQAQVVERIASPLDDDYSFWATLMGYRDTNLVTLVYQHSVPADQVYQYYDRSGSCATNAETPNKYLCMGTAIPYGKWTAYIGTDNEFTMEIRWNSCASN